MEDDDTLRLGQDRAQIVMDVHRIGPALTCFEEGRDHVGLHRSGSEEGDVDDDVVEGRRGELANEFALTG